ncbi:MULTISPECIES: squalene/phytoene synthase family protein [unclassified Limnobacter]|jgi:phytoene/squalene synthetase|uniref:squalene/phytoene synthase family protein n=1 Tax=unclassified Limnobacter TaxID=2630203 RepID=UPI000156CD51|nr:MULTISPECIES: squalene/phytoene synthase family protein [unclassified Limnobacter]EDM84158.1 Squalene/phytoene synthase [Limnobacter sp. MED105]
MAVSLENPLAYCREKVSGETASLHYATLFQTEELKAFWLGCFTLNHELRQACLKQLEAGLTQVKLGWWQNALAGAASNSNPHPVVTAISKPVIAKIPPEHWGELINRVASGCEPKRYNSMADWHNDVLLETKPWIGLVQARFISSTADYTQLLEFWATATRLCQLLRLAKYLDQGFQPLPVELLAKHGVTAEQIKRREHNGASARMFSEVGAHLLEKANIAWKNTPEDQRLFARPLRALFRMRVSELKVHEAAGYHLLTEQKIITPFKKFSTAWTTQVLRF